MVDKDKLRIMREINGYDIKKLSRKLKVSKSLIREWENGTKEIDEINLDKVCNLYNIDKKILYKEKSIISYVLSIITAIIISVVIYIINSSISILITNIICFTVSFLLLIYIKNNYSKDNMIPKSVFNIKLSNNKKDRIKLYIKESILISSLYTVLTNIFKTINLNILVVNLYLFENNNVNDIVTTSIIYLLLTVLTFIIELGFGEYIYKKVNYGRK